MLKLLKLLCTQMPQIFPQKISTYFQVEMFLW